MPLLQEIADQFAQQNDIPAASFQEWKAMEVAYSSQSDTEYPALPADSREKGRAETELPYRDPVDELMRDAIKVRRAQQMTQADFARHMGISPRTLQDWEQRRRRPSGAARTLLRQMIDRALPG